MSVSGTPVTTYDDGVSEGPPVSPALHAALGPRRRAAKDSRGLPTITADLKPACRRKVGGPPSLPAAHESLAPRVRDPTLSTAERAGGVGGALGNPSSYGGTGGPAAAHDTVLPRKWAPAIAMLPTAATGAVWRPVTWRFLDAPKRQAICRTGRPVHEPRLQTVHALARCPHGRARRPGAESQRDPCRPRRVRTQQHEHPRRRSELLDLRRLVEPLRPAPHPRHEDP